MNRLAAGAVWIVRCVVVLVVLLPAFAIAGIADALVVGLAWLEYKIGGEG